MITKWSFFYFFKKIRPFRLVVVMGIVLTVLSTLLSFAVTKIIQNIVDNYNEIDLIVTGVILLSVTVTNELIWYLIRKQTESFSIKFKDYIRIELFYDIVRQLRYYDNDASDLKSSMNEYLSSANYLAGGFLFSFFGKVTGIIISLAIIYNIGLLSFVANITVVIGFVFISYFFSKKYVEVSKEYSKESIEFESLLDRLFLSVDFLSRNRIKNDYHSNQRDRKWDRYDEVKDLHAKRWFWQLTPFKLVYVLSIIILIVRIRIGLNTIGDIVLLQWYYSTILGASVFVTESFTDLAKQKASSFIAFEKINSIINKEPRQSDFGVLDFKDGKAYLIQGENGSGKTTALYEYLSRTEKTAISYLSNEKHPDKTDLSSGEAQKEAITDIVNKTADVYIFDEPCSNTDNTDWFVDVLNKIKENNGTSVTISHSKIDFDFDFIIGDNNEHYPLH